MRNLDYLKGKCGTGIRAAWVGEKTTTSFAIYVLVRNISTSMFNRIHGTSLSAAIALDKTTDVTVGVRNLTTGVHPAAQNIANLANDPLVWADSDSRNWYGLRVRRFVVSGLQPDTEYLIEPYTDAVTATDLNAGKVADFQFKVRTLSPYKLTGMHWSCDFAKWNGPVNSASSEMGPAAESWQHYANLMDRAGLDISVCQDDMQYAFTAPTHAQADNIGFYLDPESLAVDTVSQECTHVNGVKLRDCALTVEEQCVSYADNYSLVGHFFQALLHPPTLMTAMRASVESTDPGDHLGQQNNSNFHFTDASYADALINAYAGDTTTDWYGTGGANFLTDLESCAEMVKNHKVLQEFFFGRATGAQPPVGPVERPIFNTAVTGQGLPTVDDFIKRPIWRKREHPLVDMFYINTVYWADSNDNLAGTAPYPVVADPTVNKKLGDAQRQWLVDQVSASTKPFIIIFCGDVIQQVDPALTSGPSAYGQVDGLAVTSTTEHAALLAALDAIDKPILWLTGDHHASYLTYEQDNIVQAGAFTRYTQTRRAFTVTEPRFVGQYEQNKFGNTRFVVTQNRMSVYQVTIDHSQGFPLGSDVLYVENGDSTWQFTDRDDYVYNAFGKAGGNLTVLRSGWNDNT